MSQTTTVNIRVDEDIKKDVEVLFNSLGLNISTAVNMFFRQSLMEEAIPFQSKLKHRHITLRERLKNFNGEYAFEEWNTGKDVGSEIIK